MLKLLGAILVIGTSASLGLAVRQGALMRMSLVACAGISTE